MKPNMSPNNESEVDDSLVDRLCSIASVSRNVATALLEACDNDLEMAINMQLEDVMADSNGISYNEEDVRAPIPQRQEILVEGPDQLAYSFRGRTRVTRSVFDKFRDFEAEAKRQEELMEESGASSSSSSSAATSGNRKNKIKTLEDLFRPPLDLMFRGNFQTARDAGVSTKKWLMVNIQNSSEFPCQVLNRDVWSNSAVQTIVQEHFIFWQVYHDSEDGQRYMTFYPVVEWPYIAVIDPRTGEMMVQWHKMDAVVFCEVITEFLSSHQSLQDSSFISNVAQTSPPPTKKIKSTNSILEEDESAQIEAAIKLSLQTTQNARHEDDDDDEDNSSNEIETFESDEEMTPISVIHAPISPQKTPVGVMRPPNVAQVTTSEPHASNGALMTISDKTQSESNDISVNIENNLGATTEKDTKDQWRNHLGKESDPISKLILRLPDGARDTLEIPSTSKLMALVLYVASKGFSNERFEMVTNFPKRRLSYLDFDATLKSVGLFPQETVFIQNR